MDITVVLPDWSLWMGLAYFFLAFLSSVANLISSRYKYLISKLNLRKFNRDE